MATTKTLNPTGQTVTIAEMTDRPNNSVSADGISKLVDAANALDSNLLQYTKADGTSTQYYGVSANTVTKSGRYYMNGNCTDIPFLPNGCYLDVNCTTAGYIKQIAYDDNSNRIAERTKINGTWSSWEELALNSNVILQPTGYNTTKLTNQSSAVCIKKSGIAFVQMLIEFTSEITTDDWLISGLPLHPAGFTPRFMLTNNNGDAGIYYIDEFGSLHCESGSGIVYAVFSYPYA